MDRAATGVPAPGWVGGVAAITEGGGVTATPWGDAVAPGTGDGAESVTVPEGGRGVPAPAFRPSPARAINVTTQIIKRTTPTAAHTQGNPFLEVRWTGVAGGGGGATGSGVGSGIAGIPSGIEA